MWYLKEATACSNENTAAQGKKEHEKSGNMTPPKEHNNAPVTNPKETEMYEVPDK